jgi:hypothetical protein
MPPVASTLAQNRASSVERDVQQVQQNWLRIVRVGPPHRQQVPRGDGMS